jgi:hypothetical protein
MNSEELIHLISRLQYLPKPDKEILIDGAKNGYGYAEILLPTLSIFSKLPIHGNLDNIAFSLITKETLFYASLNLKSNLGVFFDEHKKLVFNSRFYLTNLKSFLLNIDACLYHLFNLKVEEPFDIGGGFCAIEKWFVTYGHFKDETYNLANFLTRLPASCAFKAFLDYPVDSDLDTDKFKYNANFEVIDKTIFGTTSFNSYKQKGKVLKLNNLICLHNGAGSNCFHSFPINISEKIKSEILMLKEKQRSGPRKVIITRSASYRDIENKVEVERFLVERGYTLVNPEKISYHDLVCTLANTESAIFYYGSALTNMVYLSPMAKVFILKSQSYMPEKISLWAKVISSYKLDVSEIYSVSNVIDLACLDHL